MGTVFTDTFIRNLKTVGRYTDLATQGLNLQVKAGGVNIGHLGTILKENGRISVLAPILQ